MEGCHRQNKSKRPWHKRDCRRPEWRKESEDLHPWTHSLQVSFRFCSWTCSCSWFLDKQHPPEPPESAPPKCQTVSSTVEYATLGRWEIVWTLVTTAVTTTKWSSKRQQIHLWQIIMTTVIITDNIAHFCPMCHLLHLHWTLVIVVQPVCRACIAQLIHRITI